MRSLLPIAVVALAACAGADPQPPCDAAAAWQAGQQEAPLAAHCAADAGSAEAHLLGSELAQLRAQAAQLKAELEEAPQIRRGAFQRQLRRLQVDIEAIEGLAVVNGWR